MNSFAVRFRASVPFSVYHSEFPHARSPFYIQYLPFEYVNERSTQRGCLRVVWVSRGGALGAIAASECEIYRINVENRATVARSVCVRLYATGSD